MWVTYGDEKAHKNKHKDMTMIQCGVHGDEITPIKFCFDIIYHLNKNWEIFGEDKLVVVALDRAFRCAGLWLIPMANVVNPKSATLSIVRTTPGTEVIVETSIDWLR